MKINSLSISNVGPFCGAKSWDFNHKVVAITGPNGSGKTFLLEAITAVLYGKFPTRPGTLANHRTHGVSPEMNSGISMEFLHDGTSYWIIREVRKGVVSCELGKRGRGCFIGPKVTDVEKYIENLLGSYDTFIASVFSSQQSTGDVCDLRPADRKAFFSSLLGLNKLDEMSAKAHAIGMGFENENGRIDSNINILRDQMAEADGVRSKLVELETEVNDLGIRMAGLAAIVQGCRAGILRKAELEKQLSDNKASTIMWRNKLEGLQKEIDTAAIKIPGAPECATCPLADVVRYTDVAGITAQMNNCTAHLNRFEGERKALRDGIDLITVVDREAELIEVQSLHDNKVVELAVIKSKADMINSNTNSIEELTSQKKDVAIYAALGKAFGPNGIQPLIIDTAAPKLEVIAREFLSLACPSMSIRFSTLKELKSGKQAESLDIIVSKNGVENSISNLSGGERKLIKTVLRIVFCIYQHQFSGRKLSTLVIDELFDDLDFDNSSRLLNALFSIEEYFERIIVVTHDSNLLELFPQVFHLRR